jgi:predicted aldo/keto reductase-like oxidoreductase
MKYRRLGKTGLPVSVIGVGTWQLGGEWGQRFTQHNVDQLLGRAGELGVTWSKPTSATATTSPRPTVLVEFLAG